MSTPMRMRSVAVGLAASALTLGTTTASAEVKAHTTAGAEVSGNEAGVIYTFGAKVDANEVRTTVLKAMELKREIYVFSGNLGCDAPDRRSFDDDLLATLEALGTPLPYADSDGHDDRENADDASSAPGGTAYEKDVFVASAVTEDVLRYMAPEVKRAVSEASAVAIFAFCRSTTWITSAKDSAGQPLFFK
jgi:hypothetical protein